jgi:chaperonin cofactor prefoldin
MEMNETNELNEQLQFFCDNNTKIHLDLNDGMFLNGFILKKVKEDIWWLQEDKIGKVFLFSKSIKKLCQFIDKEERKCNGH